jgi:hypothetical protein
MASKGKRWLIGCGLGCGGMLVLIIVLAVGFAMWINGPSELLQPETLRGSDTTGYVEWTLTLDDPGTEGFVRELIRALQSIPPETSDELPPVIYNWLVRQQKRGNEEDLRALFPMVAAWGSRAGETGEESLHLFSLSIKSLGRRLRIGDLLMGWFLRTDEIPVDDYLDEKIYQIRSDKGQWPAFFIRNGNIFFTSDRDTARVAVDRLITSATPGDGAGELEGLFAETTELGETAPLRGALTNANGELGHLWEWLGTRSEITADPELWNRFRGAALAGGLQADGSLAMTVRFHCPDEAWVEAHALDLIMALHDGLAWAGPELRIDVRPEGDRIDVHLHVPGLTEFLTQGLQDLDDEHGDSGIRIQF